MNNFFKCFTVLFLFFSNASFAQEVKTLPLLGISSCDEINGVAIGKDSTIWAATLGGITFYKNDQWDIAYAGDSQFRNATDVAADSAGNLWFSSEFEGVAKYDGTTWTSYKIGNGPSSNFVYAIHLDKKGNIWCGTDIGISKFDGRKWINYDTSNGFKNKNIYAPVSLIIEDNLGNICINLDGGVSRFDGKSWKKVFDYEGFSMIAYDIKNQLYVGAVDKLIIYKDGTFKSVPLVAKLREELTPTCMVQQKNGTIWLGMSGNGIVKMEGDKYTHIKNGLNHPNVKCIYLGKDGRIWFGTGQGLSYIDTQ